MKPTRHAHNFAGIFFADHRVIWATAYADRSINAPKYPGMTFDLNPNFVAHENERAHSFETAGKSVEERIHTAVALIKDSLKNHFTDLKAVTTATIGPFENGRSGDWGGGKIIEGARSTEWSGKDVYSLTKEAFAKAGHPRINLHCLTDAEAMVAGEHYFYRHNILKPLQEEIQADKSGAAGTRYSDREKNLGEDTVAYLLVDQGVGGAVFRWNDFIRGHASLELGHLPLFPYPDLKIAQRCPENSCGAHYLPCAEGTIAFPALKESWGLSREDLFKLDKDSDQFTAIAYFIAQTVQQIVFSHTPKVVLIGGGVFDILQSATDGAFVNEIRYHYKGLSLNRRAASPQYFPHYEAPYNDEEFIKAWTQRDAGVLGCLVWSFRLDTDGRTSAITRQVRKDAGARH